MLVCIPVSLGLGLSLCLGGWDQSVVSQVFHALLVDACWLKRLRSARCNRVSRSGFLTFRLNLRKTYLYGNRKTELREF